MTRKRCTSKLSSRPVPVVCAIAHCIYVILPLNCTSDTEPHDDRRMTFRVEESGNGRRYHGHRRTVSDIIPLHLSDMDAKGALLHL